MERLITNFKHWLIKKLGGYVETPSIDTEQDHVVHLCSNVTFKYEDLFLHTDADVNEKIKLMLAQKIAREIIDNNYLSIIVSEDDIHREYRIKAELSIHV